MIQFLTKEIYDFANFISDDKVPPVDLFVVPNCDSLETEDGEYGFGMYIPKEHRIIVAEGVEDEVKAVVLGTLAHEYYHHIQHCNGEEYDEDAADKYAALMLERWEGKLNA